METGAVVVVVAVVEVGYRMGKAVVSNHCVRQAIRFAPSLTREGQDGEDNCWEMPSIPTFLPGESVGELSVLCRRRVISGFINAGEAGFLKIPKKFPVRDATDLVYKY